ncbi:hypothetical protein ACU686_26220 [Yinghuangia aomiensis]
MLARPRRRPATSSTVSSPRSSSRKIRHLVYPGHGRKAAQVNCARRLDATGRVPRGVRRGLPPTPTPDLAAAARAWPMGPGGPTSCSSMRLFVAPEAAPRAVVRGSATRCSRCGRCVVEMPYAPGGTGCGLPRRARQPASVQDSPNRSATACS